MAEKYSIYLGLFLFSIIVLTPIIVIIWALSRTAKANRERRAKYFREVAAWQNQQNERRYATSNSATPILTAQADVARKETIGELWTDITVDEFNAKIEKIVSEKLKKALTSYDFSESSGDTAEIYEYFKENGVNIYSWERVCWKCKKKTRIYTYLLNADLELADISTSVPPIGISDINVLDKYMEKRFPTIKMMTSKAAQSRYMANTCSNCSSLQGRDYVVRDIHDIDCNDMEKYIFAKIPFEETGIDRHLISENFGGARA